MKRRLGFAFVPVLVLALAGCGLIPPVPIDDPFHIDGANVTVDVPSSAPLATASAITPQTVQGSGSEEATFADDDGDELPLSPSELASLVSFAPTVFLDNAEGPVSEITLSNFVLSVQIWDGAASFGTADADRRVDAEATYSGPMTLTYAGTCPADTGCQFSIASASQDLFDVSMTGAEVSRLLDIVSNGGTNYVAATITLDGDPDALAGGFLVFSLDAASGEISF